MIVAFTGVDALSSLSGESSHLHSTDEIGRLSATFDAMLAKEIASSTSELAGTAQQLDAVVSRFKVTV